MSYFILAFLFIVYLELIGRAMVARLKREIGLFSFPIGFIALLSSSYITTSILSALNCSFYLIFTINIVIVFLFTLLFIKEFRRIDFSFSTMHVVMMLIMVLALLYYSYNTTLGELNGFDTTHYLNLVTNNIGIDRLNSKNVLYGNIVDGSAYSYQYTFQSYYYFASSILYLVGKFMTLFKIEFYYATAFIWIFQVLFFALLSDLILESLNKLFNKEYIIYLFIFIMFILGYGRQYYNSVFGFYGNTLRTVVVGFALMYLVEYFRTGDIDDKYLFYSSLLCACSLSSSGVFILFFVLYALSFIDIFDEDTCKEYAGVIFVPLVNLLTVITGNLLISITISSVACFSLYLFRVFFKYLLNIKYVKLIVIVLSIIVMVFLSYKVTNNIFDFSAFFNNNCERYDMTLDYFSYNLGYKIIKIFKFISISMLFVCLVLRRDDKYIQLSWILILVLFNPFCCSILNQINVVYYRAHEIILNPYTFIYLLYMIRNLNKNKVLFSIVVVILCIYSFKYSDYKRPLYYHDSYKPQENYNRIYKMNNNQIEIIRNIKDNYIYNNISTPRIVSTNLLTQSMIPNGIYYFGRDLKINKDWEESEYQMFAMFYPVNYYGDERAPSDVDYDHMCKYINASDIDYLVVDKNVHYYNIERELWYPLNYKVDECGTYAYYENDDYSLYYYE